MKRKILSFLLVACMLFVGCATLTACKETPPPAPVVVTIGSETKNYNTLHEAIVAETEENVIKIKLNQDLVLTQNFTIDKNEYEINLNGHNISFPSDTAGDGIFWVKGTGKLTINGNGTINSASQNNDYSMAVFASENGHIIINGGTYTNVGAKDFEDPNPDKPQDPLTPNNNELIHVKENATIEINGGTFIGNYENDTYGTRYTLNKKDADRANCDMIVKGGMFREFDPANNLAEGANTNFVANGYVSTLSAKNGVDWYVVSAE